METSSPLVSVPLHRASASTLVRRSASRTVRYDSSLPAPLIEALWVRPEELLSSGRVLRKTEKMRSTVLLEWGSRWYVMKHYGNRSWRHTLKHFLTGSPARQSYEVGCTLADAGILTPRPVAAIECVGRGFRRDSYLIYPHVVGRSLSDAVRNAHMSNAQIDDACRELKVLWRQLIALRVGLRDANTGNFIVTPQGSLWLIDLDDCRFHQSALVARTRLHRRWVQLCRNLRRAKQSRDQKLAALGRAA